MTPAGLTLLRSHCAGLPHGTRSRYVAGRCRCVACSTANRQYANERNRAAGCGDRRGLIDATPARRHILALSRRGIGYKAVAAAASLSISVVFKIRSGERQRIRANHAERILAVDMNCMSDGALIDAGPTWELLNGLICYGGYTQTQIAAWLGSKAKVPTLQISENQVTVRTAYCVEQLIRKLDAGLLRRER